MDDMTTTLRLLDGSSVPVAELEAHIEATLQKASVAGLSCAIINDCQVVYRQAFGVSNAITGARANPETAWNAASLSKAAFAYLVMLLVEEGTIDLDKPLHEYLPQPLVAYPAYADLKGDKRYRQITARMALSHSTGFPNVRFVEKDHHLKFLFAPGERFSYSGEGIQLLQMVVEERTGRDLETLAQEMVFRPLGMARSSYLWRAEYDENAAAPHDESGRQRGLSIQASASGAGGSMVTTAGDFARLISLGILNVGGKRKATIDEMLRPQIAINAEAMFGPGAWQDTHRYQSINLAWGLGWGRFDTPYGRAFFHTGHGFGFQNYTVTFADKGIGIVLLSNSDAFESIAREILAKAIGDTVTPFDWLGYIPFDPARQTVVLPPEPVFVQVDPAILSTFPGVYDMPPVHLEIKFEDGQLWVLSQDGKRWDLLVAESETRFVIKGNDTYRFEFMRDAVGSVTGCQLYVQGIPIMVIPKVNAG